MGQPSFMCQWKPFQMTTELSSQPPLLHMCFETATLRKQQGNEPNPFFHNQKVVVFLSTGSPMKKMGIMAEPNIGYM